MERYLLRRAIAAMQERFQLRLQAADLSYGFLPLRVTLRDVQLAAEPTIDTPFFDARQITLWLPRSVLSGPFSIEALAIDEAHLRVVRDSEGRTNLPRGKGVGGEPDAIRLGSITVRRLGIEVIDRRSRSSLVLPDIDLNLSSESGRLGLREPGHLTYGDVTTTVQDLRGSIAFDGRSLNLAHITLRTDALVSALDGDLALLVAEPRVDLRAAAKVQVSELARWVGVHAPPAGEVDVRATIAGPLAAPVAQMTVASQKVDWRQWRVTNLEGQARVTAETLDIERLDARLAGGRVAASGTVPFGDAGSRLKMSFDGLDLEALAARSGASMIPRTTGRASGTLDASGPITDPGRWRVAATMEVRGGDTSRNQVALDGRLDLLLGDGSWKLVTPTSLGVADLSLRAALGGRLDSDDIRRSTMTGLVELFSTPLPDAVGALRRSAIVAEDIPVLDGSLEMRAVVDGTFARPRVTVTGTGEVSDIAPLAPGTPLGGPADVSFESDLRTANIKARVPELGVVADGTIALSAPYAATVDLTATNLELDRALRGIETAVPITGTAIVSVHLDGSIDHWKDGSATIEIASLDALAGALPVRLARPARATVSAQVADIASLEVLVGETHFAANGRLPLVEAARPPTGANELLITSTGDLAQFLNAVAATGLITLPDLRGTGRSALLARVTGSAQRPEVSADLELGPGTIEAIDLPPVTDVVLRAHSDGAWVELRDLTAAWQGSRIEATGRIPIRLIAPGLLHCSLVLEAPAHDHPVESGGILREERSQHHQHKRVPGVVAGSAVAGGASLDARVRGITAQVLAPFVGADTLAQIAGSVDATLHLENPTLKLDDLTGEVRLDRMEIRIADLPVAQREPTRIVVRDGFAQVDAWRWEGQGATLDVKGRVRLTDRQTAILADGRFDLRMLTPFTRGAGVVVTGSLEPRLSVTGTIESPRIDGVASIAGGEVRIGEPRLVASELNGRIVLAQTGAQLTSLSGTLNGGTLSGEGTVDYGPREPIDVALTLAVDGMALEFPEGLRSELDADLGLSVNVPAADVVRPGGRLSGTVSVQRGAYREPIAVMTGLLAAIRTGRLVASATAAAPSLVDNIGLDVRLLTKEDVVVDNNIGRLQLGADLRVIGTLAAPSLSGRADVREGGQLFIGRNRYAIESGTIDFANPVTVEPDLNLRATTRAGGEDIELTIKGKPDQLEVVPRSTSDPKLGQADVVSLLLTGRPLGQISGDEAEIVGEQVVAYLSGDVLAFAGRAVGLDTIRVGGLGETPRSGTSTALEADLDPTARLNVGKSFGNRLDVTFSQGLRESAAQTWVVDYRPFEQVEFRFVSNDLNLRSYEFRHDVSFGGLSPSGTPAATSAHQPRELVGEVTITGAKQLPEARLRGALSLELGDEFDAAAWQADRDRLEALLHREGFYEARLTARREGEGTVELTYHVVEGPRCSIDVSGHGLDSETIAALRRAWTESVFDDFLVGEASSIVRARLSRDGYIAARVEASLSSGVDIRTLRIAIEPGSRVGVRRIRFDGIDAALASALDAWAAAPGVAAQAAGDPAAFERALIAWLRARGHLRASVDVETPSIEGSDAVIPVRVEAGPVFTIAGVQVQGVDPLAEQTLIDATAMSAGMPFDPAAVDAARERLQTRYRLEGFTSARVDARPSIDDETEGVRIIFLVTEGPRQVVREIQVSGNRRTDTEVITQTLDLPLGEPVGADEWLQARRRLFDTGLFRRVDVAPEPIGASSEAEQPMRARVTVQEWPAFRLRYGFAVEEQRPEGEVEGRDLVPGLSADITKPTLFRRAITLGAAFDYQRQDRRGRGFVTAPMLFGMPITSSFVIERAREYVAEDTLVTDVTEASWEQQFRLIRDLRLSYSYRFEVNHTFDTRPTGDDGFLFDLTVHVATLNAAVAHDTRDDPGDTSRGWLLSSSLDYAPEALGSDIRFTRFLAQAYYFRPWRGVVLASAARLGLEAPLGGQDIIPSKRFFAGGPRTVRGVPEDSLGPRSVSGIPTGGESLLILNQEVRFPIYRWLRGVGFVDAGNVYAEASDIDIGDLVSTFGFGLRLATPFAIFRLDYGRRFDPGIGQGGGRLMFGIGQAF